METKLNALKTAAALGDWKKAIAIAARFPRLGVYRAPILDAHMAYTNPRFLRQIGRNEADCIKLGIAAITSAYKLND